MSSNPQAVLLAAIGQRLLSAPPPLAPFAPNAAALRETFFHRNIFLDAVYYDIGSLTTEEARFLAHTAIAEGDFLVVPPSGQGRISHYKSIDELVQLNSTVRSVIVTGVGSSALGAGAFARNVADGLDEPVVAVVSGDGLRDAGEEASGGWWWFGTLNRMRHTTELLEQGIPSTVTSRARAGVSTLGNMLQAISPDTRAVLGLLLDERLSIHLLAGHSKGNLVISEALYGLGEIAPRRLAQVGDAATVVTVSARIKMPDACTSVVDIIGQIDVLGTTNSDPLIPPDTIIPWATHTTNRMFPTHIDVPAEFRALQSHLGRAAAARDQTEGS